MKKLSIIAITLFSVLVSCKKDEETSNSNETGTVKIELEHVWGMNAADFHLNHEFVHPMTGDSMNFATFKYYMSNFKLKKADGTWWTHPNSYFLVDLSQPATLSLDLSMVPTGEYTEMSYLLGVDSLSNIAGAQTGALAVSNNMFWSWNSGYIMVKAEGTSPQSSTGSFAFHLGGFKGANNVLTTKNISFAANNLTVGANKTSKVFVVSNPAKLFHADPLSSGTNLMMPGAKAKQMATNYYSSFAFDHLEE